MRSRQRCSCESAVLDRMETAELAARDLGAWNGRVAFVPLDGVSDPSLVLLAVAGAIGVSDEPGRSLLESSEPALEP